MSTALALALARPLEEEWRAAIDRVALARKWPTTEHPAQLGALVRALSDAYNAAPDGGGRAVASSAPALAARLGFSFARDVPKSAAAVRELIASRAIASEGTLRVLDVGAGLGATTWGLARALSASGARVTIEATWTDDDAIALDVASELVTARSGRPDADERVVVKARTERRRAGNTMPPPAPYDVILAGQVLSELDPALDPTARVVRHTQLLASLVASLAPGGAVVVVEPALRERTRHLHAVRDALLAARAASVFAPCLHDGPCPALAMEGEWCHEDLAIDLPDWLVPVARAAGLRWQGLTFTHLVLRAPDAPRVVDRLPGARTRLRVVSDPIVTKGKRELFVCGDEGERTRVTRLDRDRTEANATWDALRRGDVVAIDPPPDPAKPRVVRDARVALLEPTAETRARLAKGDAK